MEFHRGTCENLNPIKQNVLKLQLVSSRTALIISGR